MKILNFYSIDNIIINNLLENRKKFQEFEEFGNKVSRILDHFLKNPFGEFRRKTFELEESEFKNYSIYSPSKETKKKKKKNLISIDCHKCYEPFQRFNNNIEYNF